MEFAILSELNHLLKLRSLAGEAVIKDGHLFVDYSEFKPPYLPEGVPEYSVEIPYEVTTEPFDRDYLIRWFTQIYNDRVLLVDEVPTVKHSSECLDTRFRDYYTKRNEYGFFRLEILKREEQTFVYLIPQQNHIPTVTFEIPDATLEYLVQGIEDAMVGRDRFLYLQEAPLSNRVRVYLRGYPITVWSVRKGGKFSIACRIETTRTEFTVEIEDLDAIDLSVAIQGIYEDQVRKYNMNLITNAEKE